MSDNLVDEIIKLRKTIKRMELQKTNQLTIAKRELDKKTLIASFVDISLHQDRVEAKGRVLRLNSGVDAYIETSRNKKATQLIIKSRDGYITKSIPKGQETVAHEFVASIMNAASDCTTTKELKNKEVIQLETKIRRLTEDDSDITDKQKELQKLLSNASPDDLRKLKETSQYGKIGFWCGLCGLVLFIIPIFSQLIAIVGIVFSIRGIKQSNNKNTALYGIILGSLGLIIGLAVFISVLSDQDTKRPASNQEISDTTSNNTEEEVATNRDATQAVKKCTLMEASDIYSTGIGQRSNNIFNDAKSTCQTLFINVYEENIDEFSKDVEYDWSNRKNEIINGKSLESYLPELKL